MRLTLLPIIGSVLGTLAAISELVKLGIGLTRKLRGRQSSAPE